MSSKTTLNWDRPMRPMQKMVKRFSAQHKVPLNVAEVYLRDCWFYCDFFVKAKLNRGAPWLRARNMLYMLHGIWMTPQTVQRWYTRIMKIRTVEWEEYY